MDERLLRLRPKRYLCPYCGEWHGVGNAKRLCEYKKDDDSYFECQSYPCYVDQGEFFFYSEDDTFSISTSGVCGRANSEKEYAIPIRDIKEDAEKPVISFTVPYLLAATCGIAVCNCSCENVCNFAKLCDKRNGDRQIDIPFGFEFDKEEYAKIVGLYQEQQDDEEQEEPEVPQEQQADEEQEEPEVSQEQQVKQKKEGTGMATAMNELRKRVWECSPKDNVMELKAFFVKHNDALKGIFAAGAIFAAYHILKNKMGGITRENVAQICKRNLGFDGMDKKTVARLMGYGKTIAGAYAVSKVAGTIFNKAADTTTTTEEIDNKLSAFGKEFGRKFLKPDIDDLLPVAVSVLIVYLMTEKPEWFELVKEKVMDFAGEFYYSLESKYKVAKAFIAEKLGREDGANGEGNVKKAVLLVTVLGIGVLLYGKGVLTKYGMVEEGTEKIKAFMFKIVNVLKKMAPTVFAGTVTFLSTSGVLKMTDDELADCQESPEGEEEVTSPKEPTPPVEEPAAKKPHTS